LGSSGTIQKRGIAVRALYFFAGIALLGGSVVTLGNRTQLLSATECGTVSGAASEYVSRAVASGDGYGNQNGKSGWADLENFRQ